MSIWKILLLLKRDETKINLCNSSQTINYISYKTGSGKQGLYIRSPAIIIFNIEKISNKWKLYFKA